MWKFLILSGLANLVVTTMAFACSCQCNFDMNVSDYVQKSKIFWGIPTESKYVKEPLDERLTRHLVLSKVEVIEGYGRIENGTVLTIKSTPEDGASCGIQLYTGVPQLIIAGSNNGISSCACPPPTGYLLDFLKEGEDRYLPDLNGCWDKKSKDRDFKTSKKCKVWADAPDDNSAEYKERMNIYRDLRDEAE